ncbi:synaptosomal-associated protein 47-like [Saccostrea echinata]|uniref:synaptosomal-associated protein 47-like n=1 Tax=Saccostrea echinata TaxID=191078 RepID=UPI002A831490|nr:synaptosomal-associated protein 47-like [Saccostrea echinata]
MKIDNKLVKMSSESSTHETYTIKSWPCSYYDNSSRRWIYGTLFIMGNGIRFTTDHENTLDILYSDIVQVKKCMTGLIFRAMVLDTKNGTKHWFSSFSDIYIVVQFISFFLRSKLLQKKNASTQDKTIEGRTEMGQNLLSVAIDSETTLRNAAETLVTQGHQFDSAMATMMDLHSDLDVTENLLSGLESWLGRWSLPEEYKSNDPLVVSDADLSMEVDYEILYTKLEPNKLNAQNLGIFRVAQDGIYLMTEKQKLVHCFKWKDVSRVRVVSLWEITVTQFQIGKADISYSLVFTSVYSVLGILDKRLRSKVEYSQDAFRGDSSNMKPLRKTVNTNSSTELFHQKTDRLDNNVSAVRIPPSGGHMTGNYQSNPAIHPRDQSQQVSLQAPQKIVSDQEVSELSSILGDLKSLALGVQQEMVDQDEKIDKLSKTVEEANVRVEKTVKRVQKLL